MERLGPFGEHVFGKWAVRVAVALLLATLLYLAYRVLENFFVPLLWAAILAYVTWPINCRVRQMVHKRSLSALLMTLLLAILIVLPILALSVALRQEAQDIFEWLVEMLSGGAEQLPPWLLSFPFVGGRIATLADQVAADPQVVGDWLAQRAGNLAGGAADAVGAVGRNAMKFGMALFAVFFVYRDGEKLMVDFRRGIERVLGGQSEAYWEASAAMTRAVVYGLVLTAIAQGALAGIGYWFVGLGAPALLGILTAFAALVPFGAPVVWGGVAIYLLLIGDLWGGLGLLAWGALAVSSIDNLIRPLVISYSSQIPFLIVLLGVLGGLSAFGLVGLFLGPVVLSVLLAVWQRWLLESETASPPGAKGESPEG